MELRRVTSVEVDENGHVKRLHNDLGEWLPQSCADVVADLEMGICSYYVPWAGERLPVHTAHEGSHVYLVARTSPYAVDQLLQLPRIETAHAGRVGAAHPYAHLGD